MTVFLLLSFFFTACNQPSPLYGKWADNRGDDISFFTDETFLANINDSLMGKMIYEGDYQVLLNSLVLSLSDGRRIVSEWDIRGNMLYLNWTDENGDTKPLTLYKVAN